MRTPDEHKLDRQFREGLAGSEGNSVFREEDWEDMERLLDENQPRRRGLFWLYAVSAGIAAALLLFLAWPVLRPDGSTRVVRKKITPGEQIVKVPQESGAAAEQRVAESAAETSAGQTRVGKPGNVGGLATAATAKDNTGLMPERRIAPDISRLPLLAASWPSSSPFLPELQLPAISGKAVADAVIAGERGNGSASDQKRMKQSPHATKKPSVALAIVTAPDINGVNSLSGGRLGANVGVMLSVRILPGLSVSTGLAYAVKPYAVGVNGAGGTYGNYSTGGSTYGGGSTAGGSYSGGSYGGNSYGSLQTSSVDANCKVLDIPLNINYQIYRSGKSAVSAGTGLSSYFMLRETYKFNYTDNTSWSYHVSNKNKHLFGVLNINASYQRQMNTRLNLVVQPYLKIPLTDIGNEGVDLRSAGVAFGVGWTINSRKR